MSVAARVVVSDGHSDPETGSLHAASPIIIGFVAAVFGMTLLVPGAMRHWPLIMSGVLMPVFVISVAIYAWSVLSPGDITGLIVDRASRTVELVQTNAFATRRTLLRFEDVARVALEQSYDHDGYSSASAMLTLASGERLPLAVPLNESRIAELQGIFGHAR